MNFHVLPTDDDSETQHQHLILKVKTVSVNERGRCAAPRRSPLKKSSDTYGNTSVPETYDPDLDLPEVEENEDDGKLTIR